MNTRALGIAAVFLLATSMAFAQAPKGKTGARKAAKKNEVSQVLMRNEESMLAALQKKDIAGFKKYVMAGSWSLDENGFMTVDDFVKAVEDPKSNFAWESYKTSEMKVVNIDAKAKIVAYKLDEKGSMLGQPFPPVVYATTAWANQGGRWMAVFHQESTAAKK